MHGKAEISPMQKNLALTSERDRVELLGVKEDGSLKVK